MKMESLNRRPLLAALFVALLAAGACGASGDNADSSSSSDGGTEAAATDADSVMEDEGGENETGAAANDAEEAVGSEESDSEEAQEMVFGGPVGPGVYTTSLLGTPVTFDFDREWIAAVGSEGGLVFVDPATEEDTAEVVLVTRMNSLAGPGEAAVEPSGSAMSGPSDDLGAWIESVGELDVEGPVAVTGPGIEAERYDVTVTPDGTKSIPGGCGPTPDDRCFFVGVTGSDAIASFIVRTSETYRMWMMDQGAEDGLLVTAMASASNPGWLDDRGDAFFNSMSLGDPEPHPIQIPEEKAWESGFTAQVPAGPATFPALGGVELTMPESLLVQQDGNCLYIESTEEVDAPFPPHLALTLTGYGPQPDFTPITSVEQYMDRARDGATWTATGETITVLGSELMGYTLSEDEATVAEGHPPLENSASCAIESGESNLYGYPGPFAKVYLGLHEGKVLAVAAVAFTEVKLPVAQALFDQIGPTIKLAE